MLLRQARTIIRVFPLNEDFSSGSNILSFTKHIIAAFSTQECASLEQYAINFDKSTPSSTKGCCCFSLFSAWALAASIDTSRHSLADVWKAFQSFNLSQNIFSFQVKKNNCFLVKIQVIKNVDTDIRILQLTTIRIAKIRSCVIYENLFA